MARSRGERDVVSGSPPSDAYVGMLGISLGALLLGCLFLYLDWSEYPGPAPKSVPAVSLPPSGGGNAPSPPPGGGR